MVKITKKYKISDSFQQIVGGMLLAGPFVVTEEVWRLAGNMSIIQFLLLSILNLIIGYATLYKADKSRDPEVEQDILGIPYRFISLIIVSVISVCTLALLIGANTTFASDSSTFANAMCISSTFSIIGAATADSVF